MRKRLLLEANDSDEEEGSGKPKKSVCKNRKARFLAGSDSSSEEDTFGADKARASLLNPLHKEVISEYLTHGEKIGSSTNSVEDMGNCASLEVSTPSPKRHRSKGDQFSARPMYGSPDVFLTDEYRPAFESPFVQQDADVILYHESGTGMDRYKVNRHVARYLLDHQVVGVKWLFGKVFDGDGAILGDDMGMGKTVQIAALLNALFYKTGSIDDKSLMKEKRHGTLSDSPTALLSNYDQSVRRWYALAKPVLIVCPKSLVANWRKELETWGFFLLEELTSLSSPEVNNDIIKRAKQRRVEVILLSYSQVSRFISDLTETKWTSIVFDEGHMLKNAQSKSYMDIMRLRNSHSRLLLTGTPVQNDLRELWSLLNLIYNGDFTSKAEFIRDVEKPIKRGMSSSATKSVLSKAKLARDDLRSILKECLLARKKHILQGEHALKGKDEIIVFCDLSPLQQRMYEECLASPEFDNVRYSASPCPCGSELPRSRCCDIYRVPYLRDRLQSTHSRPSSITKPTIDPRAALWRQFHPRNIPCGGNTNEPVSYVQGSSNTPTDTTAEGNADTQPNNSSGRKSGASCPLCMLLPCLNKLGKIACHPALLQCDPQNGDVNKQQQALDFVGSVFSAETISQMGGLKRTQEFLKMRSTSGSGKMQTLREMLRVFVSQQEKTLIFSLSTQVLDLLQAMIVAEGWRWLRLDGQTPVKKRQQMVDLFNRSNTSTSSLNAAAPIFIFLISSRAGGLGLNLATASKVIIFDVDWNPVVDMQSQDRAYRIGQKAHVSVYRLVSKGTVEELAYMRQLYKQQLQQTVLGSHHHHQKKKHHNNAAGGEDEEIESSAADAGFRRGHFEGIEGETTMRGELFGVENLFQFSRESILQTLRARLRTSSVSTQQSRRTERSRSTSKDTSASVHSRSMDTMDVENTRSASSSLTVLDIFDDVDDDDVFSVGLMAKSMMAQTEIADILRVSTLDSHRDVLTPSTDNISSDSKCAIPTEPQHKSPGGSNRPGVVRMSDSEEDSEGEEGDDDDVPDEEEVDEGEESGEDYEVRDDVEEVKKVDKQQESERCVQEPNYSNAQTADHHQALQILQTIGINLQDARKNEELLEDGGDEVYASSDNDVDGDNKTSNGAKFRGVIGMSALKRHQKDRARQVQLRRRRSLLLHDQEDVIATAAFNSADDEGGRSDQVALQAARRASSGASRGPKTTRFADVFSSSSSSLSTSSSLRASVKMFPSRMHHLPSNSIGSTQSPSVNSATITSIGSHQKRAESSAASIVDLIEDDDDEMDASEITRAHTNMDHREPRQSKKRPRDSPSSSRNVVHKEEEEDDEELLQSSSSTNGTKHQDQQSPSNLIKSARSTSASEPSPSRHHLSSFAGKGNRIHTSITKSAVGVGPLMSPAASASRKTPTSADTVVTPVTSRAIAFDLEDDIEVEEGARVLSSKHAESTITVAATSKRMMPLNTTASNSNSSHRSSVANVGSRPGKPPAKLSLYTPKY